MKVLFAVTAVAALLAIPATAGAGPGGKPTFHDHDTFSEVDPNFCDTGTAVQVAGRFNFVGWVGETGGDPNQELKVSFNYSVTFTNPINGRAVIDSAAGTSTNEIVTGLESGAHTHLFVDRGLRAKLQLEKGRVLTHDAGTVTYLVSFDAADNFLGLEVVSMHGPHPSFGNDLWCETATEALGID
jgi:hypothetical protein